MIASAVDHQFDPLPHYLTEFIGRERETARLEALLLDPDVRVLTLTGLGGVGKTRLLVESVRRCRGTLHGRYPDGLVFVDAAPVDRPERLLADVALALGIVEPDSDVALAETVSEHLANRSLLLLVDNLEHQLPAGRDLARFTRACPGLKLVATSRAPLRISGEAVCDVPPMTLPGGIGADEGADAVRLFTVRARSAMPGFAVDESNRGAVEEICRRLDGLPLAIELAAARLRLLSVAALLARLEKRLQVLGGGPVDAPLRHQTLRDTIAWSEQLLRPAERQVFRRLGVFPDAFSLDAAEAVCLGPADAPGASMLDLLSALVDHSLVRPMRDERTSDARFRLLPTIREYALEMLEHAGEAEATRLAHALAHLDLAERTATELTGPDQVVWMERLTAEREHLRTAVEWSLTADRRDLALRFLGALWRFWRFRGMAAEARSLIDGTFAGQEPEPTPEWAEALRAAAVIADMQRDGAQARAWAGTVLAIQIERGDDAGQADCQLDLGGIARNDGDFPTAIAWYARSAESAAPKSSPVCPRPTRRTAGGTTSWRRRATPR
ncbi:MAG: ATP-binding protein [Thermomicrobiales bacterium]